MANKKKALGRGIDALFSDNGVDGKAILSATEHVSKSEPVLQVEVSKLEANPFQPRKIFNDTALEELTESIRKNGIIQPLVVRKMDERLYQIVAGERRYRAAKKVGIEKLPIVIRDFDDDMMMEIAIVENLQRENLSAIEEAQGIRNFMDRLHLTQEQAADRLNKSRASIANLLRLLNLPEKVQGLVNQGKISMGHARALLRIEDPVIIERAAVKIVAEGLSVRQTEQLALDLSSPSKQKTKVTKIQNLDVNTREIVNALEEKFGSKVDLDEKKLSIKFHSKDDLNRILEILNIEI